MHISWIWTSCPIIELWNMNIKWSENDRSSAWKSWGNVRRLDTFKAQWQANMGTSALELTAAYNSDC